MAKSFEGDFSLALLVTLVVSFHLLLHDLCIAFIPALLMLSRTSRASWDARKFFLYGSLVSFFLVGTMLVSVGSKNLSLLFVPLATLIIAGHLFRSVPRNDQTGVI